MKKLTLSLAAVLAVGVIGGASYQLATHDQPKDKLAAVQKQAQPVSKISFSADKKIVTYDGVVGATALQTLKTLTDATTQSSDYGDMVTAIHGMSADPNSQYWAFYVNGKLANVGAGTYTAVKGDKIEWRLEKF